MSSLSKTGNRQKMVRNRNEALAAAVPRSAKAWSFPEVGVLEVRECHSRLHVCIYHPHSASVCPWIWT